MSLDNGSGIWQDMHEKQHTQKTITQTDSYVVFRNACVPSPRNVLDVISGYGTTHDFFGLGSVLFHSAKFLRPQLVFGIL